MNTTELIKNLLDADGIDPKLPVYIEVEDEEYPYYTNEYTPVKVVPNTDKAGKKLSLSIKIELV